MVRRTKRQENKTVGTIHWLTCIPIDLDVLDTAVIVLQLIYSAVNVQTSP